MAAISIDRRDDGIALVAFDDPDRPMNTITPEFIAELESQVAPLVDEADVKGIVLISGKDNCFIAGADIKGFASTTNGALVAELDARYSHALTKLARAKTPVVAAVHGPALGGGLETALAADYILATDDPSTVLGLPEVRLGILPAAGGTQRFIKRVGLLKGLPMILTGKRLRAREAKAYGLVEAVVAPDKLADAAIQVAQRLASKELKPPKPSRSISERLAELPILRGIVLKKAREGVLKATGGKYPAPGRVIDCVAKGLKKGEDAGLAEEVKALGELFETPQSRALIWLFVASQDLKQQALPAEPRKVNKLGVIGAGLMGAGIASVSLAKTAVIMRDINEEALERGEATVQKGLAKQVRAGSLRQSKAEERGAGLTLTQELADLAEADLVVEAVFEDLALKQKVLAQAEEVISPDTVFASNTSGLPIHAIVAKAKHPERVVGMHYFSPVPKMPLLELVVPDKASDRAVATAWALGQAQGKSVIAVKDTPGFYTTRILSRYLNEAVSLLKESGDMIVVDQAMQDFGFPVGPLKLMDEVGIDVAAHVAADLGQAFGERWGEADNFLARMAEAGLLGRKAGKGFYSYPQEPKAAKTINPEALELAGAGDDAALIGAEVVRRMVMAMVNEALYCLEEEVIASPADGDLAAVLGLGFPPFIGGPFHCLDELNIKEALENLQGLHQDLGSRFAPPALLTDLAQEGVVFFPSSTEPGRDE